MLGDAFDPRESLRPTRIQESAEIMRSEQERPRNIQVVVLDLTTARGEGNLFKIPFPFKTVFVRDTGGDTTVNVDLVLHSTDAGAYVNRVNLKLNDSFNLPSVIANGYIGWSAQANKSITLYFALEGEFKSGQQLSLSAGGVNISDGTSFRWPATQAVIAAAAASLIVAADSSRKGLTFVNESGNDMWIGGSTVTNAGATKGLLVAAGEKVVFRNQGALYGYSVAGTTLTLLEEF